MLNKNLLSIFTLLLAISCSSKMSKSDAATVSSKSSETPVAQQLNSEDSVVFFALNESKLNSESKKILDGKVVKWLKKETGVKVLVQGHCDERGSDSYNQKLGIKRAQSVRKYLIKHGIKSSRISIVSYGESKPVEAGHNEEAWAKNRRAVVGKK